MQAFCAYNSAPDPYEVLLAGGGEILLHSLADDDLTWADGTTQTTPAGTLASSAYGGNSVDNHLDIYYLLVIQGNAVPLLVKERDIATADSLVPGTWAKRLRVENGIPTPTPQP